MESRVSNETWNFHTATEVMPYSKDENSTEEVQSICYG